jgi:dihydrofolate reductase
MAKVILGMTTSLDGFVADREGSVGRLYPDLVALRGNAYMNAIIEETGAVLMGRRTFEMGTRIPTSATMSSRYRSSC